MNSLNNNNDIEMQNFERKLEIAKNNDDIDVSDIIEYSTCCSKTSKSFLNYISRLIVSLVIVSFSMYMVIISEPGTDNSIYFSLISGISSAYISHQQENKQ